MNAKKWMMMLTAVILLIATGCGNMNGARTGSSGTEWDMESLQGVQEKLQEHLEALENEFSIQLISLSTIDQTLEMNFRAFGDVEKVFTEEELNEMKSAMYEYAGQTFPIRLTQTTFDKEADIRGKITDLEKEKGRVLIVHPPTDAEQAGPSAAWVTLTEDAKVFGDGEETLSFKDLQIGQQVNAWSTGLMMESYPVQTSVVKIEITKPAENSEDLSGTVTEKKESEEKSDFVSYVITVDGQEIEVTEGTEIVASDQASLAVGDEVKVWLLGYTEANRASKIERVNQP